jgi:hypothetical protein
MTRASPARMTALEREQAAEARKLDKLSMALVHHALGMTNKMGLTNNDTMALLAEVFASQMNIISDATAKQRQRLRAAPKTDLKPGLRVVA